MNIARLLYAIEYTLKEIDNPTFSNQHLDETALRDTKAVLSLLKEQILNQPQNINQRVLRAMHDVGMYSFRYFENTWLEKAILSVTEILYNEIPDYKRLKPLRRDFGKGDPI